MFLKKRKIGAEGGGWRPGVVRCVLVLPGVSVLFGGIWWGCGVWNLGDVLCIDGVWYIGGSWCACVVRCICGVRCIGGAWKNYRGA